MSGSSPGAFVMRGLSAGFKGADHSSGSIQCLIRSGMIRAFKNWSLPGDEQRPAGMTVAEQGF
jgi:hypothetical protein